MATNQEYMINTRKRFRGLSRRPDRYFKGLTAMYSQTIWILFTGIILNGQLSAEKTECETPVEQPVSITTFSGTWSLDRDPSQLKYKITNVIVIKSLVKGLVVSDIKRNAHSLRFQATANNPETGKPYSTVINLIPDVRSNERLLRVVTVKAADLKESFNTEVTEDIQLVDLMTRVHQGAKESKSKKGYSKTQLKCALEDIYSKQWDISNLFCTDCEEDKVLVQILTKDNQVQANFSQRGNQTQVPAQIVDNAVAISVDSEKSKDLIKIPVFKRGINYQFQLIPMPGSKDQLVIKASSIKIDRTASVYFLISSVAND